MTISLYELTSRGWKQTLPGCIYFIEVYKSDIIISMHERKYLRYFTRGKDRRKTGQECKDFIREIMNEHKKNLKTR